MTDVVLYKYSGAGNDFIVIDGRRGCVGSYREAGAIRTLCDRKSGFVDADGRTGADGLMILSSSADCDFKMEFFNPDGSTGMMCGNGGRCIAAFADNLGIVPGGGKEYVFEAADGTHRAAILSKNGNVRTVRLKMIDPFDLHQCEEGWFVNTGTRHLVRFVDDLETLDVATEGARLRHLTAFAPEGVNVDFVSVSKVCIEAEGGSWSRGTMNIRTFEKGVEAETMACGTGIVAAALVHCHVNGLKPPQTIPVRARQDILTVDILPEGVWLTGPAELIDNHTI